MPRNIGENELFSVWSDIESAMDKDKSREAARSGKHQPAPEPDATKKHASDGVTKDQRGQIQPKDKSTAQTK
jgi:hypothetical protein